MPSFSDITSYFWSTPPAPVSVSQRPSDNYQPNAEPFKSYHKNRLMQFRHHKDILSKHDIKFATVFGLTMAAWAGSSYSYVTTVGFLLAGVSARLDYQRKELVENYQKALTQLKSDLLELGDSGVPWSELLKDKQVQEMFTELAPFVKKDELKLWSDSDLKVKGMFGGETDRTDLPRHFVKLLDKIDSREFESNLQYSLYNAQGHASMFSVVMENAQKIIKAGFSQVTSLVWSSSSPN